MSKGRDHFMNHVMEEIENRKIVPVVKIDRWEDAKPLAAALCAGGLPVAEVTFRTDAAEKAISMMCQEKPDMLVGAGTIVNIEQAKRAVEAGAAFLVTPGLSEKVIEYGMDCGIPVLPGVCTPSEVVKVMEYGIKVVKFFPAKQYGGLATIKALAAPFPGIRFMPTGGINESNLLEFLAYDRIIACGGSWMVKDSYLKEQNFAEIQRLTEAAVSLVRKGIIVGKDK